jgi:hypothetical protein
MEDEVLSRLLSDLQKVRHVCLEENLEEVPEICVDYLNANRDALEFFVEQVFSKMDRDQRSDLQRQHSELDVSVVTDEFLPIASNALHSAVERKKSAIGKTIFQVDEDDLHMLLRALEYARYCPLDSHHFELRLSPIEEWGLKRRFGNFNELTREEFDEISWHVAEILYESEKSKALAKCRELGLDLNTKETSFRGRKYPDWKQEWTGVLLDMLKYKAECDCAVVLHKAPKKRSKYLNAIDRKLDTEYAYVISDVREALQRLFAEFQTDSSRPPNNIDVESELELLKKGYADLRSSVVRIQPRPSLFEDVNKMLAGGKETVMGDKFEFHGQAVGVGRNVNIGNINFNQVWDQSRSTIDLGKLADDLGRLREAMLKESTSPEHFAAVGAVASAEVEARKKQGPAALEYLSKAGKWALDVATKIGVPIVIEALKKTVGI